jgi:hypothetical protein
MVKLEEQNHSYQHLSCISPVCTFRIVSWLRKEIEKIDQKTRRFLTIDGIHHPSAEVIRLYIKSQSGGCGLFELESTNNVIIVGLTKYIKQGRDRLTRLVQEQIAGKAKYSVQKEADVLK